MTSWWYPFETQGGAMMEGRVVLPLPPEVQWHEATPVVLPGAERRAAETRLLEDQLSNVEKREREAKKKGKGKSRAEEGQGPGAGLSGLPGAGLLPGARAVAVGGFGAGSGFGEPAKEVAEDKAVMGPDEAELARLEAEKAAAKQALRAVQRKNDPELVAYARELRDRWQEHTAPGSELGRMIESKGRGRYAVGRLLEGGVSGGDSANNGERVVRVVEAEGTQEVKRLPKAA
ncbi:hypothetical protein [Algisphaera agarilytica]|nr:hypothetical protein [Algisphaera agarilytica]